MLLYVTFGGVDLINEKLVGGDNAESTEDRDPSREILGAFEKSGNLSLQCFNAVLVLHDSVPLLEVDGQHAVDLLNATETIKHEMKSVFRLQHELASDVMVLLQRSVIFRSPRFPFAHKKSEPR